MQHHILPAAAANGRGRRQSGHRRRLEARRGAASASHETQRLAAFGHERIAAGQQRHAVGMRQPAGGDDHAQMVLLGGVELVRSGRQRDGRHANRRRLLRERPGDESAETQDGTD
jgi:hypothetical protein